MMYEEEKTSTRVISSSIPSKVKKSQSKHFPTVRHKFDEWTKHVLQMFKNEP